MEGIMMVFKIVKKKIATCRGLSLLFSYPEFLFSAEKTKAEKRDVTHQGHTNRN